MTDPTLVDLARTAHAGQTDAQGRDYFDAHLRPIAEAAAVFGDAAEAAGWLHDVVEDTETTLEDLLARGVSSVVVEAVASVTRTDETYEDLIGRACAHPIGRLVKLADNAWNITCNPVFARVDPNRAAQMLRRRYLPARRRLLEAAGLRTDSPEVVAMQAVLDRHLARLDPTPR